MSRAEKLAHATRLSSGLTFILIVTTHSLLVSFSSPHTNCNGSLIETATCRGKWCTTGAIINFRLSTAPKTDSDHRSPSSCYTSSSSVTNCDIGYNHDPRHDASLVLLLLLPFLLLLYLMSQLVLFMLLYLLLWIQLQLLLDRHSLRSLNVI